MKEQDAAHFGSGVPSTLEFQEQHIEVLKSELTCLRSELQQKDEVIKEIYEGLQLAYGELIQVSSNPVLLEYKKSVINKIESLIKTKT